MPLLISEDFEHGAKRWLGTDPTAWKVVKLDRGNVYSLVKQSRYKPKYRSPLNFALLKNISVSDFVLTADVQSTAKDKTAIHRDICIIFGYQDPNHFYYVHLANKADDHANQIFVVNDADRRKISTETTTGTPWDDNWHKVKVLHLASRGAIGIYFDDMRTRAMKAKDTTFVKGRVGLGSFDDLANFDNVKLYGKREASSRPIPTTTKE